MTARYRRGLATAVVCLILVVALIGSAAALDLNLGSLLKIGGVAFLVSQYGGDIDNFINRALGERQAQAMGATKVVPIVSIGQGGEIGAAQIVGVPAQVKQVQAVVQVETKFGSFGGSLLVPISTKKPPTDVERVRVGSVGVSAIISIKL